MLSVPSRRAERTNRSACGLRFDDLGGIFFEVAGLPADGRDPDAVPEPAQLAVHALAAPARVLDTEPNDQIAQLFGNLPALGGLPGGFGCVHLRATMRWCQAGSVRGETIRCSRNGRGSSLANAASTAGSAQSGFGAGSWRRSTDISCRSTRISTSFAADDRAGRTSQASIRQANR